jgi:hypothetical protein
VTAPRFSRWHISCSGSVATSCPRIQTVQFPEGRRGLWIEFAAYSPLGLLSSFLP